MHDVENPVAVYLNQGIAGKIGFHTPVFILSAKKREDGYEVTVERKDETCSPPGHRLMALDDKMPGWVRIGRPVSFIYIQPASKPITMFGIVEAFQAFVNDAIAGSMLWWEFVEMFSLHPDDGNSFRKYLACQDALRKTRMLELSIDMLNKIDEAIATNILRWKQ